MPGLSCWLGKGSGRRSLEEGVVEAAALEGVEHGVSQSRRWLSGSLVVPAASRPPAAPSQPRRGGGRRPSEAQPHREQRRRQGKAANSDERCRGRGDRGGAAVRALL
jgi:hypothetical protein